MFYEPRTYTPEFGAWVTELFKAYGGQDIALPGPRVPGLPCPGKSDYELFMEHCTERTDTGLALKGDPWDDEPCFLDSFKFFYTFLSPSKYILVIFVEAKPCFLRQTWGK